MHETPKVRKIAFVGAHSPRKCGIATFTSDLLAAVANNTSPSVEGEIDSGLSRILVLLDDNTVKASTQRNRELRIVNQDSVACRHPAMADFSPPDNKSPVLLFTNKTRGAGSHLVEREFSPKSVGEAHRFHGGTRGIKLEHQDALCNQCADK